MVNIEVSGETKQDGSVAEFPPYFTFIKKVSYHETDAMGVVHHSSYIKYFEDARVEWMRMRGLMPFHAPYGDLVFAVMRLENRFFKPARFDDELEVWLQTKLEGVRLYFQYKIFSPRLQTVIGDGLTELVAINSEFRPSKMPPEMSACFELEPWDDTWRDRRF